MAASLLDVDDLAGLLGDRHRIIANDWQAAEMSALAGRILHRAAEMLEAVEFTPAALRRDLGSGRTAPRLLHSASELISHAADLLSDSAGLVHDNEPRWRRFRACGATGRRRHGWRRHLAGHRSRLGSGKRGAILSGPPSEGRPRAKPLLGLRQQPGRLALAVFRVPLGLYRRGRGWVLGHAFLVFTHVGRKTGRRYETAAMILSYDQRTGEAVICSAWGPNADWIRNLRATPAVEVRLGRETFVPDQHLLTDHEAFAVGADFQRRHPWRMRLLSRVLGWGDLRSDAAIGEFVGTHPFVSFRPARRDDAPLGTDLTPDPAPSRP